MNGSNLADATVRIPTDRIDPSDPTRIFPGVSIDGRDPVGAWIRLRFDATDTRVQDFYNLIAENGSVQALTQFRVIPQGPLVDMWTPGRPKRGQAYVLSMIGKNLNATVNPSEPDKLRVFNVQSSEEKLNGLMEVFSTAPLGPTTLVLTDGQGRQTLIEIIIESESGAPTATNLTQGLAAKNVPPIYLQEYVLRTAVSQGANVAPLCHLTINALNLHWQFPLVFCEGAGDFRASCLQGVELAGTRRLGELVLSLYFRVDLTVYWNCFPISAPRFCVKAVVASEVPGYGGVAVIYNFCPVGPAPTLTGTYVVRPPSLTLYGNSCVEVVAQDSTPTDGISYGTLELIECCTIGAGVSASGTVFDGLSVNGVSISRPFGLTNEPAAVVTPSPTCEPPPGLPEKLVDLVKIKVTGGLFATRRSSEPDQFEGPIVGANQIWQPQSASHGFPVRLRGFSFRELHAPTHPNPVIRNEINDVRIPTGVMTWLQTRTLRLNDLNESGDPYDPPPLANLYFVRGISDIYGTAKRGDHRMVVGDDAQGENAGSRTVAHEFLHVGNVPDLIVFPGTDPLSLAISGGTGTILKKGPAKTTYEHLPPRRIPIPEQP